MCLSLKAAAVFQRLDKQSVTPSGRKSGGENDEPRQSIIAEDNPVEMVQPFLQGFSLLFGCLKPDEWI